MSTPINQYHKFLQETKELAAQINPYRTDDAKADLQESMFSDLSAHDETMRIAFGAGRKSCMEYEKTYGEKPSAGQLAMSHKAIKNVLEGKVTQAGGGEILLEASETSTHDIPIRNIFLGMILPATLMSISSRLTTPFPANPDKADIFRLYLRAASNWNGYTDGQLIDEDFRGGYGNMDLYQSIGTGDGATTSWSHTVGFEVRKERVKIMVDMDVLGTDDGNGNINGTLQVNGTTISLVSSTVNYTTGAISLTTSAAVPNGLEIEVKLDADIETNPSLIPKIKYDVAKFEVLPHESVIASQYTLQAMLNLQRNYQQSMATLASRHLLNLITANTDRIIIANMYKGAKGKKSFDATLPSGLSISQHYPTVGIVLDEMDSELVARNKKAGLFALVCGVKASRFFRSMAGMGVFQLAPNYRSIPQPHFVGRFQGVEIYEDPQLPAAEAVGVAKGSDFMRSGYYSSIAVPYMPFKHSVQDDLRYKTTLYGVQFRDFAPVDGREYFMRFEVLNF